MRKQKKTVTRRLLKKQPPKSIDYFDYVNQYRMCGMSVGVGYPLYDVKPIYWPGLKLWVREKWAICGYNNNSGYEISVQFNDGETKGIIDLDNETLWEKLISREKQFEEKNGGYNAMMWRSSLFMPRAASRFLLKITDVKIERLHELDDIDAVLEGCKNRVDYARLWNEINGKSGYTWNENPFVYRIQFENMGANYGGN